MAVVAAKWAYLMCMAAIACTVAGKVVSTSASSELIPLASRQLLTATNSSTSSNCTTFNVVVNKIGDMITSTVDIVTGTVDTFYSTFYSSDICGELDGFRCFLKEFHSGYSTFSSVINKIVTYKTSLTTTDSVVAYYFKNQCWKQ